MHLKHQIFIFFLKESITNEKTKEYLLKSYLWREKKYSFLTHLGQSISRIKGNSKTLKILLNN